VIASTTPHGLHPDLLDRVKGLVAQAQTLAVGGRTGVHRSRLLGGGSEFSEYKAYEPGDDLRFLDWKVQARSDRYVVKRFQTDRVREVQLILDRTGSMEFGTTGALPAGTWGPWPGSKWEAGSTLALAMAFIFLRQGDRVGLWVVEDGTGQRALRALGARAGRVPVRGGVRHLTELAAFVLSRSPSGEGSLAATLKAALAAGRRSEVIVISDLLSDTLPEWLGPLGVHAARGREVQVMHVVDPAEIEFPYDEPTLFEDLEGGDELSANPRELARSYREEFTEFLNATSTGCAQRGVRYLRLRTDEALEAALVPFLRGKDVRRGA